MIRHDSGWVALAIGPPSAVLRQKGRPRAAVPFAFMCGRAHDASCERPAAGCQAQFPRWIFSYTILVALTNFVLSRVISALAGAFTAPGFVMAGLVPAIHAVAVADALKTWMPGTRPGMTEGGSEAFPRGSLS